MDDLVQMVNVALGTAPIERCLAGDVNQDELVSIEEIIRAVVFALGVESCQR